MIEHTHDIVGYLAAVHDLAPSQAGATAVEHHHVALIAADNDVNTQGLSDWVKKNVIGIIILAIACVAGFGALKSNAGKVITVGVLGFIVLALAALAGSAAKQETVGSFLLGLFGL